MPGRGSGSRSGSGSGSRGGSSRGSGSRSGSGSHSGSHSGSADHGLTAHADSDEVEIEDIQIDEVEIDEIETDEVVTVSTSADCVWDQTGDAVDEVSMNEICALYTESECISSMNGKSKGRCLWKGKMHSKTSKFHANVGADGYNRQEMVSGQVVSQVMSMQFSTFDVLLGTACFATLAFVMYHIYQWCLGKAKEMGIGHDYTPLREV